MATKWVAWRVLALFGLILASTSWAEEWRSEPLFCGFQSGCEAVTRSAWGKPLGLPLPAAGLIAFGSFYLLTLFPSARSRPVLTAASLLAGFAGLGLVLVQALVLRQFCRLCLLIDGCAMLLAVVELAWPPGESPSTPPVRWAWAALALVGVAAPPVLGPWLVPPPPLPAEILARQRPGVLTVVSVTDFQCDHCRRTHPALREALAEYRGPLNVVRLVYPLPAHANARDAARAYFSAARLGRGEEMAEALFTAKDLSPAGCEALASELGLELSAFRAGVVDPRNEQLLGEAGWVTSARVPGLPAIWIGTRRFTGLQTVEALRAAVGAEAPH